MPGGYGWPTSVDVSSGITERDAKQGFVWGNYFKHPVALFQTRLRLPRCEICHPVPSDVTHPNENRKRRRHAAEDRTRKATISTGKTI